jgi:hypothetical protein
MMATVLDISSERADGFLDDRDGHDAVTVVVSGFSRT